ncbi:MAG TPA: preprotein translocase subunit YajC [Gemmatimonadales bacterium]|nr:preprotein translocase subunit YajC [Gemmatimonadales bacterium]
MTAPFFSLLFAPSGQAGPSMSILLIQVAAIFGIFYLFIIRPQRKQRQEHEKLLASLAKGDQVITSGGIIGEVVHIKDNEVTIRSGEAKFVLLRSNIATVRNREEPAKSA